MLHSINGYPGCTKTAGLFCVVRGWSKALELISSVLHAVCCLVSFRTYTKTHLLQFAYPLSLNFSFIWLGVFWPNLYESWLRLYNFQTRSYNFQGLIITSMHPLWSSDRLDLVVPCIRMTMAQSRSFTSTGHLSMEFTSPPLCSTFLSSCVLHPSLILKNIFSIRIFRTGSTSERNVLWAVP